MVFKLKLPTEYQIYIILMFSYIYDAIRNDFIESKIKRLKESCKSPIFSNRYPEPIINQQGTRKSSTKLSRMSQSPELRILKHRAMRHLFVPFTSQRSWKKAITTGMVISNYRDNKSDMEQGDNNELKMIVSCPLAKMPIILRLYTIFSHIFITISFIKYGAICLLQYEWIGIDKYYSCFLPGRLAFVNDLSYELPGFSWVIIFYHVVYRIMFCIKYTRINLDCFVFSICDKEFIEGQERNLEKLNEDSIGTHKLYLENDMFFQRISLLNHKVVYRLKSNRTLEHWKKLRAFINQLTVLFLANFIFLGAPILVIIALNLLSNEYFDGNYGHCRSFANRTIDAEFQWDFSDSYRMIYFFFDGFDNFILLFDTSNALVWPFSSSIICTRDLTDRIDDLSKKITELKQRLEELCLTNGTMDDSWKNDQNKRELMKILERDVLFFQSEVIDTFTQVSQVDEFISKFSAFCIFCWVVVNLCYQFTSILRKRLLNPNGVVQFLQILGLSGLTFTFVHLGRPHSSSIRLYHKISNFAALDPNIKTTKCSWIWLFEYFDEETSRFSLHLGWNLSTLSMTNYLKSIVWFVSCALIVINLLRYKL